MPADKRTVDELRADEAHLRLAQEAGKIGTWEWDLTSGAMRWSAQMFRNLGIDPRRGGDLYEVLVQAIHPGDRDQLESSLSELRCRPGPVRIELRSVWPGGEVHWIVFLGEVIADAAGRPARMLGVSIDGTQRRRGEAVAREHLAEERARQLDVSRAQMHAFFDNSPDWLTLFRETADGGFVYEDLNGATVRAYGLTRDQVLGRRLETVLGAEQAELPLRHMRICIETGEDQRYTARRTMGGVTRTVDVMFVRVEDKHDSGRFIIATARDITERETIEQQLRQAQKMEAVGQLTGGIAHDFNNLLTAVLGNLELLAPRIAGDALAAKYVGGAQRAASNGAKLTEQLLAFSRRQHLQPRTVNVNTVIRGMTDLLTRTIGSTVRVATKLAPELWPALIDPTQIEIAILNLAINARDAMPLGGTLTIETRNHASGHGAVPSEIGTRDCICLSVHDAGTGMSEDVLRSAVEPFFTTKAVGKGSGLGLSQVYGVVRQSGGGLDIESQLGRGTTVHLYLPRAAGEVLSSYDDPDEAEPDQQGGRILVVDDDPNVREITVQMLQQLGYDVAEVESGQAALDALGRGEIYDLMVIDIAMPVLSGIETVRRARERWPTLRALLITGYADAAPAERRAGDDVLVKKPFSRSDLRDAVRHAIKRAPHDAGQNLARTAAEA